MHCRWFICWLVELLKLRNGLRGKEKHSVGLEGNMIQKVKKRARNFKKKKKKDLLWKTTTTRTIRLTIDGQIHHDKIHPLSTQHNILYKYRIHIQNTNARILYARTRFACFSFFDLSHRVNVSTLVSWRVEQGSAIVCHLLFSFSNNNNNYTVYSVYLVKNARVTYPFRLLEIRIFGTTTTWPMPF